MIDYISQGTVEHPSGEVGNFDSFVANLLHYMSAKNYQNKIWFDKVIAKIKRVHIFAPQCIITQKRQR